MSYQNHAKTQMKSIENSIANTFTDNTTMIYWLKHWESTMKIARFPICPDGNDAVLPVQIKGMPNKGRYTLVCDTVLTKQQYLVFRKIYKGLLLYYSESLKLVSSGHGFLRILRRANRCDLYKAVTPYDGPPKLILTIGDHGTEHEFFGHRHMHHTAPILDNKDQNRSALPLNSTNGCTRCNHTFQECMTMSNSIPAGTAGARPNGNCCSIYDATGVFKDQQFNSRFTNNAGGIAPMMGPTGLWMHPGCIGWKARTKAPRNVVECIALHSFYHIPLKDACYAVNHGIACIYAVVHRFKDKKFGKAKGSFLDEAKWTRYNERGEPDINGDHIEMSVGGDNALYEHPSADYLWEGILHDGQYKNKATFTIGGVPRSIAWQQVREYSADGVVYSGMFKLQAVPNDLPATTSCSLHAHKHPKKTKEEEVKECVQHIFHKNKANTISQRNFNAFNRELDAYMENAENKYDEKELATIVKQVGKKLIKYKEECARENEEYLDRVPAVNAALAYDASIFNKDKVTQPWERMWYKHQYYKWKALAKHVDKFMMFTHKHPYLTAGILVGSVILTGWMIKKGVNNIINTATKATNQTIDNFKEKVHAHTASINCTYKETYDLFNNNYNNGINKIINGINNSIDALSTQLKQRAHNIEIKRMREMDDLGGIAYNKFADVPKEDFNLDLIYPEIPKVGFWSKLKQGITTLLHPSPKDYNKAADRVGELKLKQAGVKLNCMAIATVAVAAFKLFLNWYNKPSYKQYKNDGVTNSIKGTCQGLKTWPYIKSSCEYTLDPDYYRDCADTRPMIWWYGTKCADQGKLRQGKVFAKCIHNATNSCCSRILNDVLANPKYKGDLDKTTFDEFEEFMDLNFDLCWKKVKQIEPMPRNEWCKTLKSDKLLEAIAAGIELDEEALIHGVTEEQFTKTQRSKCTKYMKRHNAREVFLKYEYLCIPPEKDKCARVIMAPEPQIKVLTGSWCYTVSKQMMKKFGNIITDETNYKYGKTVYLSGYPRDKVGAVLNHFIEECTKYGDPWQITTDHDRFDLHHHKRIFDVQWNAMNKLVEPDGCIKIWQADSDNMRGKYVKYPSITFNKLDIRGSGGGETTAGNTINNIGSYTFSWIKTLKDYGFIKENAKTPVWQQWLDFPIWAGFLGDDNITILPKQYCFMIPRYHKYMSKLGWSLKVDEGPVCEAEFCSSYLVPCRSLNEGNWSNIWLLLNKPGKVLFKFAHSCKPRGTILHQLAYVKAILQGYRDQDCIPFMRAWRHRMIYLIDENPKVTQNKFQFDRIMVTEIKKWTVEKRILYRMRCSGEINTEVNDATIEWIMARYQISVIDINELTDYMSNIPSVNTIIDHPILTKILNIDTFEVD